MIDLALLLLRVVCGIVFVIHGKMKFTKQWASRNNIPRPLAIIAGTLMVVGGICLIAGFFTRIAALGPFVVMMGALYFHLFRWNDPFVGKGGYEYALVISLVAFLFFAIGGGAYSLDAIL